MKTLFDSPEYSITDLTGDAELGDRITDGQEQLAKLEALDLTAELDDLNKRSLQRADRMIHRVGEALASSNLEVVDNAVSLLVEIQMHGQTRPDDTIDPEFKPLDPADALDLTFLKRSADRRAQQAAKKVSARGGSPDDRNRAAGQARDDSSHAESIVIDRRVVRAFGDTLQDLEDQLDNHLTALLKRTS